MIRRTLVLTVVFVSEVGVDSPTPGRTRAVVKDPSFVIGTIACRTF